LTLELKLESLNDPVVSNLSDNIPQLDGPIDDENVRINELNDSENKTIEEQEFLICEYKSKKRQRRISSVTTPKKKEHILNVDSEHSHKSVKKKKSDEHLPKTPSRSPSKGLKKITSPSCPSRNYSPLKIEIMNSPKTETTSSCSSPSTSSRGRQKIRENLRPKRILAALKETDLGKVPTFF
jgi:hypothetical protein